MSKYDPDPGRKRGRKGKSKRGRVPPQLRPWVFGRRKRRTHDPGRVYGKPYGVGTRGGVYWSGGTKKRYDPGRRTGFRARARGVLGRVETMVDKWATVIGGVVGFAIPTYLGIQKHYTRDPVRYFTEGVPYEVKSLFGQTKGVSTLDFLRMKFLDFRSVWATTFWLSAAFRVLSQFKFFGLMPPRVNVIIKKMSTGSLIASIIGGLFCFGSPTNSGTTTAMETFATTTQKEIAYYA